jgi:hypothetical protein
MSGRERITERELISPTLFLMNVRGGITTSELIAELTCLLKPTGEDIKILKGRRDTKFSQKVRNLVSHKTLLKLGYASFKTIARNGLFLITEKGKSYLEENREIIEYLLSNDFNYDDVRKSFVKVSKALGEKKKILIYDENLIITEGIKRNSNVSLYKRSRLLRDFALKHYLKKNHIRCSACTFDFYDFYGFIGKDYIEIHHLKPVFQYDDEDKNVFLERALNNLAPVCSNCHRIIHRNRQQPLSLEIISSYVKANGKFER